ncbi:hypothetical protein WA158_002395 [Blastocystis sp. Blastoise]
MKAFLILLFVALISAAATDCAQNVINQGESVTLVGGNGVGSCTLNGAPVTEGITFVNEDGNTQITFDVSSEIPFDCTVNGKSYQILSKIVCQGELGLYEAVVDAEGKFHEQCDEQKITATESICVYDPLTLKAYITKKTYPCHDMEKRPVEGHGYVWVEATLTSTGVTAYNAATMPTWLKEFVIHNLIQELWIPIKNAYIYSIEYDETTQINTFVFVLDCPFEYTADLALYFEGHYSSLKIDVITSLFNKANVASHPDYFTGRAFAFVSVNSDAVPARCYALTDAPEDVAVYNVFEGAEGNEDTTKQITVEPLTWASTVIWYYAYNNVPATGKDGETDYTNNYQYHGQFTRYCKPKYYEAHFLPINVLSAVQTQVVGVNSLFFRFTMEQLDPRSVTTEVRYTVARVLSQYILNSVDGTTAIELFDVNVHMIKGANPKPQDPEYYYDTVFYVQIRMRYEDAYTAEQLNNAYANIINTLSGEECNAATEGCPVKSSIADQLILFFNTYYGPEFNIPGKSFKIQMDTVISRRLRA